MVHGTSRGRRGETQRPSWRIPPHRHTRCSRAGDGSAARAWNPGESSAPAAHPRGRSGEARNAARFTRVQRQPRLRGALPERLVGHDGADGVVWEAIEAEDDGLRLRRAFGALLADDSERCGLASAAVGSDRVVSTLNCQPPAPEPASRPPQAATNTTAERAVGSVSRLLIRFVALGLLDFVALRIGTKRLVRSLPRPRTRRLRNGVSSRG